MEIFMKIKYLFIAQFLAWAGFTLIDLIDEETSIFYDFKQLTSIEVDYVMCFVIPIIFVVLYFTRKKLSWNNEKRQLINKILRFVILIGIWFLVTVVSTIIITILAINDYGLYGSNKMGLKIYLMGQSICFLDSAY